MVAVGALLMVAFAGVSAAVFLLHLSLRPVLSGSMRPTFAPGAAIITRDIPVTKVRAGDIIVFEPPGYGGAAFAHRVVTVSGSSEHPVITTKGDANPIKDPWHVQLDDAKVPEVVGSIPDIGWVMNYVEQDGLHILLIAIIGIGVCVGGTRAILRGSGDYSATEVGAGTPHDGSTPDDGQCRCDCHTLTRTVTGQGI